MAEKDTFEIGLVMAGAVSAGAYTAGVVDYLLEALQHYARLRKAFADAHPGKSLHNVQIRVISGASAGGMTGTMLLSSMMDEGYRPMRGYDPAAVTRPDIDANVFYRSWVDAESGIDIRYFLDNADVTGREPLRSLLNCRRLDVIADDALSRPRALQPHDYIPGRIDHFLSVFNLAGVPYTLDFEGSDAQYGLVNHSDMMHFVHDGNPDTHHGPNEIPLGSDPGSALDANWKLLRQSTLATGAFPLALQPRELHRDAAAYDDWRWWVPAGDKKGRCKDGRCFAMTTIAPDWSCREGSGEYAFVCVDGGVANNEPLEIARRALAGDDAFNPRDKNEAHRAVIMVDPFPSDPCVPSFTFEDATLFHTATRLFGSLKEQARFKPDELEMARNPDIFSRFMIAPTRKGAARGEEIASASLGAFGGFLSEKFRQHDFQLGRRNCQAFLMKYFVIGTENPLVKANLAWFREHGCIVEAGEEEFVQVVPMADLPGGSITEEVKPIGYGSIAMSQRDVDETMHLIDKRIETVIAKSQVITDMIDGVTEKIGITPLRWLARQLMKLLRGAVSAYLVSRMSAQIRKVMESDLKQRGLLKS